ncbi:hypothetical protein SAMN05446037_100146 [Anaerovirgula multivorans]|uniref:Uncharacterized protein n=1 Tax=Anaerovirgula multivorans TaxID=312168 RepID=A0A238ZRF2_9FIRM|nr:hypothetical protein [Anaerovirgula multivorans]SNR85722.1 hypothetical protein SAMN05446037_100146 [Anaerovirgula multivorans]
MERQEEYNKILDEDNTMLVEDNEILRNKITAIENFIDRTSIEVTEALKSHTQIDTDYFIGQRSILTSIKKLI